MLGFICIHTSPQTGSSHQERHQMCSRWSFGLPQLECALSHSGWDLPGASICESTAGSAQRQRNAKSSLLIRAKNKITALLDRVTAPGSVDSSGKHLPQAPAEQSPKPPDSQERYWNTRPGQTEGCFGWSWLCGRVLAYFQHWFA